MNNENFSCRLCLNNSRQVVSIFKEGFADEIELLAGFKIIYHENLPENCCLECHTKVKDALSIRSQIIKTNEALLQQLQNVNLENSECKGYHVKEENNHLNNILDQLDENNLVEEPPYNEESHCEVESEDKVQNKNEYVPESSPEEILNDKFDSSDTDGSCNVRTSIRIRKSERRKRGRPPKKLHKSKEKDLVESENSSENNKSSEKCSKRKVKEKKWKKREYKLNPEHIEFLKTVRQKREKFACPICSKELFGTYMKAHIILHIDDPVVCDTCGKTIKNPQALMDHIKYYHKSDPNKYICDQCGKGFKTKSLLVRHTRKEHGTAEKTFDCSVCGKKFFEQHSLKIHMDVVHNKIRSFKCEQCGKNFGRVHQLNIHRLVHTTENRFHCQFCGKGFKIKHNFQTHLQAIHGLEEEKSNVCPICNKGFSSTHGLKTHINSRVHGIEKCALCSEFITVEFLSKHLQDIHGVQGENG